MFAIAGVVLIAALIVVLIVFIRRRGKSGGKLEGNISLTFNGVQLPLFQLKSGISLHSFLEIILLLLLKRRAKLEIQPNLKR